MNPWALITTIGGLIVGLSLFFAALAWFDHFPEYQACLANSTQKGDCFTAFLMLSPPVQDALEINESCGSNSTTAKCLSTIGQKVAEDKLTEDKKR